MLKRISLFLLLLNVAMNAYFGNLTLAGIWAASATFWAISIYSDWRLSKIDE